MIEPATTPLLAARVTDEYRPPTRTPLQRRAATRAEERSRRAAEAVGTSPARYRLSRRGTAAGLAALNAEAGDTFFDVFPEAELDEAAAAAAFASDGPVIDVQTHWIADQPALGDFQRAVLKLYRHLAPDWWTGIDGITAYTLAEYLRCVFVESDTALAIISAPPSTRDGVMLLTNPEMAGMRELFDRVGASGRLLNHTVVHPNLGETDRMAELVAAHHPSAWKVYTLGTTRQDGIGFVPGSEWRLDDEETGLPFLEQARDVGVPLVCAHKGVSGLAASSSPRDVGPAAKAFPDVDFLIYHSGYEPGEPEGPFMEATAGEGINRLVASVREEGIGPGGNVYAELGTTWFCLISRPLEAAHVLGKLLLTFGEDNIIWGTDAIWYGPTQPATDAFRAFQIPDSLCEEFGYPKLTAETKRKILGANAARVYGIDLDALAAAVARDDGLGWARAAQAEYDARGLEH